MSGEELSRLLKLGEMRSRLQVVRIQLRAAGMKDWFHLDECDRLIAEMMAVPAAEDFREKSLSLQWHLAFLAGEYEALKRDAGAMEDHS
jgi:hypothetical protein